MNENLFLRNPEHSELGRRIIESSILLIHELGFEAFTFRKLAQKITTTEAGVYRYFENKQRLLLYLVDWYWSWQEYHLLYQTNNIVDAEQKLRTAIKLLSTPVENDLMTGHIDEKLLFEIVMMEGAKSYLTRHVQEDNELKLFKPFKDLCARIADIISEINPKYAYPHSLATTIIEMAHSQNYYAINLPALTDMHDSKPENSIHVFLEELVFRCIVKK